MQSDTGNSRCKSEKEIITRWYTLCKLYFKQIPYYSLETQKSLIHVHRPIFAHFIRHEWLATATIGCYRTLGSTDHAAELFSTRLHNSRAVHIFSIVFSIKLEQDLALWSNSSNTHSIWTKTGSRERGRGRSAPTYSAESPSFCGLALHHCTCLQNILCLIVLKQHLSQLFVNYNWINTICFSDICKEHFGEQLSIMFTERRHIGDSCL